MYGLRKIYVWREHEVSMRRVWETHGKGTTKAWQRLAVFITINSFLIEYFYTSLRIASLDHHHFPQSKKTMWQSHY
ncbi:MAG TPA: hypothetical protein VFF57_02180 [Hanamia sp.]|nr:hypothetical protein [Hanamia sp.]